MSFSFVNKPSVNYDIIDIVAYYKSINPNLAIAFLDRLEEAKNYIANYPVAFQIKYKNVRTVLLKQFPFHVHYIVNENKKQIVILAILNAYKNPNAFN